MESQAGQQPGVGHLSPQCRQDGGWRRRCSPSPSGSREGEPGGEATWGTGLPCIADFPWAMANKALCPVLGQSSPWQKRGFGAWGPCIQACLPPPLTPTSSGGAASLLRSLRGPRPLPDIHLTPIEPLFFSFKVKSLSLRALVGAQPLPLGSGRQLSWALLQHGGLLQLCPCKRLWLHLTPAVGQWGPFTTPKDIAASAPLLGSPQQGHPQPALPPHHGGEGMVAALGDELSLREGMAPPSTTRPEAAIVRETSLTRPGACQVFVSSPCSKATGGRKKGPAAILRCLRRPVPPAWGWAAPKPSAGHVPRAAGMPGRARAGGRGRSRYSHSSDANPIIPLMKSGCAANEITLWQPGSLRSAAALSMGSALLEGHLCREPPKTCSRQWGQAAGPLPACPPAWAQSPPPAAAPALPSSQQGAESGMAYNETPITGFPLLHQHGFPRGAATRVWWEGRPAGLGLLGAMASLGRLAWMLGEGGGVCSTCSDRISQLQGNAANEQLTQISREASQHPGPCLSGSYSWVFPE